MSAHLKHLLRVGLVSLVALIFAVQVTFVLPTSAQASERHFDERDLKGAYVGSVSGASVSETGYPATAMIRVVADGVGNLVWESRRNSGLHFLPKPIRAPTSLNRAASVL